MLGACLSSKHGACSRTTYLCSRDDGKRCSAWKHITERVRGAKLMTESNEHRFEFLPGRFCGGGLGGGGENLEIGICRLFGGLRQYAEVNETL